MQLSDKVDAFQMVRDQRKALVSIMRRLETVSTIFEKEELHNLIMHIDEVYEEIKAVEELYANEPL